MSGVEVAIGATLLSGAMGISASQAQQKANKAAAEAEAQRAAIAAKNAAAVASVRKAETFDKFRMAESRARALGAASGTTIPESFFAGFAEKATEQGQMIDWQSSMAENEAEDRGAMARFQAEAAGEIAKTQQFATLLGTAASAGGMYYKYGGGAPGAMPEPVSAGGYANLSGGSPGFSNLRLP